MKLLKLIPLIPAIVSSVAYSQTTWTGSVDSNWNNADNWSAGLPYSGGGVATVTTIDLDGADVVMSESPGTIGGLIVSALGNATLNITEDMTLSGNLANFYVGGALENVEGYTGVVNHTSGTVQITSANVWDLIISHSASDKNISNTGIYNFGGSAENPPVFSNQSRGVRIGGRSNDNGVLAMEGHGAFSSVGGVSLAQANGTATWSVKGGDLDININTSGLSEYGLRFGFGGNTSATLAATFTESGFSTINVTGDVTFMNSSSGFNGAKFTLELDPGFSSHVGEEFVIINATGGVFGFTGFGQFSGINEGAVINVGDYGFQASYANTRFTLTTVEAPDPGPGEDIVDTELMGYVYIGQYPWVYIYSLEGWSYFTEEDNHLEGGWVYLLK